MRYELRNDIYMIKVLDQYMIVHIGEETGPVNAANTIWYDGNSRDIPYTNVVNEAGAFYFNLLKKGCSVEEMVQAAAEESGAGSEEILTGLMKFLDSFERTGYITKIDDFFEKV